PFFLAVLTSVSAFQPFNLFLEVVNFFLHKTERLDNRVRQIRMVEPIPDPSAVALDDPAGDTDDGTVRRHFPKHDGIGADARVVADFERTEHFGPGGDNDAVADRWMALALLFARAAERYALIDNDLVSDLTSFADDDAHAVVDE